MERFLYRKLPSSIEGLMGLWEEHLVSLPFKGLDVMDESPLLFRWEWISDPLERVSQVQIIE
ncbi:hypothetical protein [Saccharolobus islandicus]|uniref:hypothetical protein n=1 Tax=Saccharolobus islandicus TaxID=43080 RepID=UPI0009B5A1EE